MPRLPPRLLNTARRQHPFLALILRETRDLPSARNELRWLAEDAFGQPDHYAQAPGHGPKVTAPYDFARASSYTSVEAWKLYRNVHRRSRGEPLQYILGSTPFGDLDILCRPGVLIPRWETEVYVQRVAERIGSLNEDSDQKVPFKILDLCTGSGCIALLLHSLLRPVRDGGTTGLSDDRGSLCITALDLSLQALNLARENLDHNLRLSHLHPRAADEIEVVQGDVLALADAVRSRDSGTTTTNSTRPSILDEQYDLVISNPPYISPHQFSLNGGTTSRSVRKYEPKIALVPPPAPASAARLSTADLDDGDTFYPAILTIARAVNAKCIVMEVGDAAQGLRVAGLASSRFHSLDPAADESVVVEVWNDDGESRRIDAGSVPSQTTIDSSTEPTRSVVEVAEDRAVFIWSTASAGV